MFTNWPICHVLISFVPWDGSYLGILIIKN